MKPNKDAGKDNRKQPAAPVVVEPIEPSWQPSWSWHLKALGGIYVVLVIAYFAVSSFLHSVPPPYRLRDIPKELTPWMK